MGQIENYTRDMNKARETLIDARSNINYYRLQIRQTKARLAEAKKNAAIKQFIALMPEDSVKVTPAPDQIYVSVHLSVRDAHNLMGHVPDQLGLCPMEVRPIHDRLNSPILSTFRHGCVWFYITQEVY